MLQPSSIRPCAFQRLMPALLLALAAVVMLSPPASAQDVMTADSAAVVKAAFVADLDVMRDKFIGLAEAFPQDKYTWRPMEGVRSVSEVLMLIATEGYGFAPTSLGAEAAMSREETQELRAVTDKAHVIDHLTKGFAYAKSQLEGDRPRHDHGTIRKTGAHGPRGRPRRGRGHARASRPADRLCAHESDRAAVESVSGPRVGRSALRRPGPEV